MTRVILRSGKTWTLRITQEAFAKSWMAGGLRKFDCTDFEGLPRPVWIVMSEVECFWELP